MAARILRGHGLGGAGLAVSLLCCVPVPGACADDPGAEYAIRWAASAGTPDTPEKVLQILGLKPGKGGKFTVRYHDVDPTAAPLSGFSAIVRERVGKKTDVAWKYRGAEPMPSHDRDSWRCPLLKEAKRKDEIDVSITGASTARRTYSRSCTSEQTIQQAVPVGLKLTPRGCRGDVTTREAKGSTVGVERWQLQSGAVFLEVSWKGPSTPAELEAGLATIVARLIASGVQPLERSMTDIASGC